MHIWALVLGLGTYAAVAVHISHKVDLLYQQMKQWSMSWAAQHISSTADDVVWAERLSQQPPQQVSPSCACIAVLHKWALYFVSVHIGHKACVSSQMKQCLVKYDLHHISSTTDDVWSAYSLVHALVLCTSERCTGTAHIRCCGSSAHQSQGLYHQIQQWLTIWDAQHIYHQLMMFLTMLSPSAATIRSKCHQHVLALMFCTSVFCSPRRSQSLVSSRSWSSAYVTAIIFVSYHFLCHLNFGFWNCWCQTSCNMSFQLSAQLQHISSAAPCQLRWNLSSQLQRAGWAVVCQLSCNLSTQLQRWVSCQLSCSLPNLLSAQVNLLAWLSAQLHPVTSDVICHVSSSASSHHQSIISAAVYSLSYILSFLGSYLMCHISWNLSAGRTRQWCLRTSGPVLVQRSDLHKTKAITTEHAHEISPGVGNDDCWAF